MISLHVDSAAKKDTFFLDVDDSGVAIPSSVAMAAIFASLRMKHDVLIRTSKDVPEVDFKKRFGYGDSFIHLSPRFMGHLADNYSWQTLDFHAFKSFLISTK